MAATSPRTPFGLLTRLFLRQFLENDAISPEADRTQLLAVVGSLAMSLTLFLSFVMSAKYVSTWMPGEAAVASLDDKFLYLAFGMIATALVAATQWDALSVDPRDAAILEPLPVPAGTIRRAKLLAVAILGGAVAIAVNLFPSVDLPLAAGLRLPAAERLADSRVDCRARASSRSSRRRFGYLVVIALRETVAAGSWRAAVQPRLALAAGRADRGAWAARCCCCRRPPTALRQRGFEGWRALSPPVWFLGVYESLAGGVIADLPRTPMTPRQARSDRDNSALYEQRRAQFPEMARRAGLATGLTGLLAAAAYLWRARRVPSLSAGATAGLSLAITGCGAPGQHAC